MAEAQAGGWRRKLRRALRQVGPVRLLGTLLFLLLGLYGARFGWDVPLVSDAERAFYDLRFEAKAERTLEQDGRIVLVTYNDDTLAQLGKRSPLDRAMLARALAAIDGMGPRAIGVDILIDQAQPEDPELVRTLRAMRTPTFLAFASAARNPDQILPWQEAFLRDFVRQTAPGPARPASIRLQTDLADGVIRRWPEQPGDLPPLLANAMAPIYPEFRDYRGVIDFRLPASDEVPVFTNLPIQFVAEFPEGVRAMIEGRFVLIGGDIQDLDNYETPMTRVTGRWTKGIEIHAHMLAQVLDGRMPAPIPGWALWIAALGVVAAGALASLLELRGWRLALVLVVQIAFFAYLPFQLQAMDVDTLGLPAFGWGAGWLLAFVGVGVAARAVGSEQRRFAQSALGKYLPPDIASEIIRDPEQLSLHGEKKQIYALFTDLEGFTKLSHAITPEQLSALLNRYLDLMSDTVLRHGGTIDKFVGDAVVAFWGAPIERPDDGDRAVRAAMALYECGEQFRRSAGAGIPPIGCTRVGLHRGEAVVGNFGGKGRMQYTALGDGMNTAARLESANKALRTIALVSNQAKAACSLDVFRPMGRVVLSGRATPCELWEPAPHVEPGLRARLTALWLRFDGGDRSALAELEETAAAHKEDAALQEFVYRLGEAGPGGHFVLGSK
ncbi:MAG TPA: adenylate/guanylate cyclase domain-containing protein [Candidatus Binatia bacterium]|nr:adenylate/guanylate cyclase domain-containing protein [Candidatus Binatia bacterium]